MGEAGQSPVDSREGPGALAPEWAAKGVGGRRPLERSGEVQGGRLTDREPHLLAPLRLGTLVTLEAKQGRVESGITYKEDWAWGSEHQPPPTDTYPSPQQPRFFVSTVFQSISFGKRRAVSFSSYPACLCGLNHLTSFENGQAYSKDGEEMVHLPGWHLGTQWVRGSPRLQPACGALCAVSSPGRASRAGQAQLQPRHGEPSALHAPLRVFN